MTDVSGTKRASSGATRAKPEPLVKRFEFPFEKNPLNNDYGTFW